MEKDWRVIDLDLDAQRIFSEQLGAHPVIAQLLINRGLDTVEAAQVFLNPQLESLHDPFLFKGMKEAIARIMQARDKNERVLVFGDYDVDGVTSSSLLNRLLLSLNIDVIHHIPHRMTDGYGLNHEIAEFAVAQNIKLLISVDCGITAYDEIETLREKNIDVVIIDHHEPDGDRIPRAVAIVNPKQKDCPYPFKELASVGLVAKVIQAVLGKMDEDILDVVSIGTIADLVPLRGENRIFVKHGLPRITQTRHVGLRALLEASKIDGKKITPQSVGFILGPRINASGRMDSAHTALDLFLTKDVVNARRLADELNQLNTDRQKMQKDVIADAMAIAEETFDSDKQKVIVLSKEGWHKGVLGIVASRLTEKFYRPSVVISIKNGIGTASARSIDGFHLHDVLSECAHCLENFGGHEGAAGLTIKEENVDPFRLMINQIADKMLEIKKLIPILEVDMEIALSQIDMALAKTIEELEPYGEGNPTPVFCSRGLVVKSMPAVMGKETIKFWVTDGVKTVSAIGFGMAKYKDDLKMGRKINLAYEIIIDDWNKSPTPQLKIKDIGF